ncbi:MAG: high frequency lysogenization protein HflD, partial [Paracoccus sp. (in: a-proteobacteria)]|nr:high frequency lysogenization protein HflD [Paracoccus sp. (in: a-proteobacteria)]
MPRALMIAGGVLAALALIVAARHQAELVAWATQQQRAFQNALAGGLRAMRAGDGGAWAGFLAL